MRRSVILLKQWLRCKENLLLGAVLVLGTVLRFHGLLWDAPYFFHVDEGRNINLADRLTSSLNLEFSAYGTVPMYLLALARLATSGFLTPTEPNDRLVARSLSAFLGSLTILLCYLAARKAYGKRAGILAAFFMACTVLHIQLSHFYVVDTPLALFIVWALYHMVAVVQKGNRRDSLWAGVFSGLSLATKFSGLFTLVPLVIAHLLKDDLKHRGTWGRFAHWLSNLRSRNLWLAITVMFGTFFLLTPFSILDWKNYVLHDGLLWNLLMVRGYFRYDWNLYHEGTPPYLYYLDNLLFWGMGPLLEIASLLGVVYALSKWQKKENVVFLSFTVAYFLSAGGLRVKFIRYALPLMPVLNIMAAYFLSETTATARGRWLRWASRGVCGLVMGASLFYSLAFANIYSSPDTRIEAARWICQNIERGATILLDDEPYPQCTEDGQPLYRLKELSLRDLYEYSELGVRSHLPYLIERTELEITGRRGETSEGRTEPRLFSEAEERAYVNRHLIDSDYVIVSEFQLDKYWRQPTLFPVQNAYYHQLFSGQLGFKLIKVFDKAPHLLGMVFDDYEAEPTFKIFDHPAIWIFEKKKLTIEPSTRITCSFADQVMLWGYDLDITRVNDGKVWLGLHWRALRDVRGGYWIYLKLVDGAYKVWGQQEGSIGSPTGQWSRGETVRNTWRIEAVSGTPPGDYQVEVILHDPQLGRDLEAEEGSVLLGPVKIPRREPPALTSLDIEHPQEAILGDKVRLLGYNIESGFRPGDGIHLTLFWQCLEEMDQDYTVFIHLIDEKQNIWGQNDNQPVDGFYPTSQWEVGEIVRDQYDIAISLEALPGEYQLEVGMYLVETGERLETWTDGERLQGDRILLEKMQIGQ